jgi:hypothetical protein
MGFDYKNDALSGIFSHFGLSKKKNSAFLDSPPYFRDLLKPVFLPGSELP